jgi:hypothetical protein
MTVTKLLIVALVAVVMMGTALAFASPRTRSAGACPAPALLPTPAASIREYAQQVERQEFDLAQAQQRRLRGECP